MNQYDTRRVSTFQPGVKNLSRAGKIPFSLAQNKRIKNQKASPFFGFFLTNPVFAVTTFDGLHQVLFERGGRALCKELVVCPGLDVGDRVVA